VLDHELQEGGKCVSEANVLVEIVFKKSRAHMGGGGRVFYSGAAGKLLESWRGS